LIMSDAKVLWYHNVPKIAYTSVNWKPKLFSPGCHSSASTVFLFFYSVFVSEWVTLTIQIKEQKISLFLCWC